jgi:hypothetical protein
MACDINTIKTQACTSGIGRVRDPIQLLQLIAQLTCEASEAAGGGAVWGEITGTLSNQADLQSALDAKLTAASNLSDVASAETSRANLGILYFSNAVAVSVAGTAGYEDLRTFVVPANSMGANGFIRFTTVWSVTNNANGKAVRILFGGQTAVETQLLSTASFQACHILINRNATNSQLRMAQGTIAAISGVTSIAIPGGLTVDTTVNQTIAVQGVKTVGGDTVTLQGAFVEVVRRS